MVQVCGPRLNTQSFAIGGRLVECWDEPLAGATRSWDTWLAAGDEDTLTLAVADAAVNTADPDAHAKSAFVLRTIVAQVRDRGIRAGLDAAAALIHRPQERYRHRSGMATFAGVEVRGGYLHAYRCADCEVWVRRGRAWHSLFPDDMLTAEARTLCDLAMRRARGRDWWTVQEILLDSLDDWRTAPVGLGARANPQHVRLPLAGVDEVVVSTDGAQLNPERLDDLDQWLEHDIHVMPPDHPHPSPHGDLTVLRWRRPRT